MVVLWCVLLTAAVAAAAHSDQCNSRDAASTALMVDGRLMKIPLSPGGPYNTTGGPIVDNPRVLNIHLVAHTHNDPGWLKNVDQYSTGANNSIQIANVGLILDSVVRELQEDTNRKFIYVEM
ncbi:hypothetical protein FOZ63_008085, partial [Perkinsus olseni]